MTEDDVLFGFRLALFTLAQEVGSVSEACREMGVARSTTVPGSQSLSATASTVCEHRRTHPPRALAPRRGESNLQPLPWPWVGWSWWGDA